MIDVDRVLQIHHETVVRWHEHDIEQRFHGVYGLICQQHAFNFRLWHEEDIARSPDATDQEIAQVKRNIDKLNQQRNDWIEKIDEWLLGDLAERRVAPLSDARKNTETPGSAIDRLSIMSLRLYHLNEQASRSNVDEALIASVNQKITIGLAQLRDLAQSLRELLADIYSGHRRHGTYQQMKMYNDPQLNPYLYNARHRKAG